MPGSAPGERRGGRQKGTPNKAKAAQRESVAEALKVAFAALGPIAIDEMSPAEIMRLASREAIKAGHVLSGVAMAKDAAPYFDAKLVPTNHDANSDYTIIVKGGLGTD